MTGDVKVQARNAGCCVDSAVRTIAYADAPEQLRLDLALINGQLVATCSRADVVDIKVDGRSVVVGEKTPIYFGVTTVDNKSVTVVFTTKDGVEETKRVVVASGKTESVECAAH
jgi:hypothetical protein